VSKVWQPPKSKNQKLKGKMTDKNAKIDSLPKLE
jgi:hypothetical protein